MEYFNSGKGETQRMNIDKECSDDDNPLIIKAFGELEISQYGLGFEIFNAMKRNRNKIAQYIEDTKYSETFDEILEDCVRVAINLGYDQFSKDDVLGLSSGNHKDSCVPYIAALFMGITVVAFDTSLSVNDRVQLLHQVTPKVFFVEESIVPSIEESLRIAEIDIKIVVIGESGHGYFVYSDYLVASEEDISNFEPIKLQSNKSTAAILFSSGTTGLPKGICLSHYGLLSQSLILILSGSVGNCEYPVALIFTQLYWISSVLFLIAASISGMARVILNTFNAEELWGILARYRINILFLSPFQCHDLCKSKKPEGVDTSSLHTLITAGGSISKSSMTLLRDILPGTFISPMYGQTEVCGSISMFQTRKVEDQLLLHYKPESVGRPIPGFWYKVVDTETEEIIGPNRHGELRIKSGFAMNGYFRRNCIEAFDKYGWLKTGDLVYYDEYQCFYVVDRLKELLKFQGWHVQPAMLEKILMSHPAVQKAVVVGVPDEEDGEHPLGLVILNDGVYQNTNPKQLELYVEERVQDRQRLRAGVKIIDSIPLTYTGKVRRQALRDLVLSGKI